MGEGPGLGRRWAALTGNREAASHLERLLPTLVCGGCGGG